MTTYVSCHGEVHVSTPDTFVPRYIPAVKFYGEANRALRTANELGILARADAGLGAPSDTYTPGGAPIPNYSLRPDEDIIAALSTYFEPSGGNLYRIPHETALCMGDAVDDSGAAKPCSKEEGVHHCSGLFGTIAWNDSQLQTELVMLICRTVLGAAKELTADVAIGADRTDTDTWNSTLEFVNRFVRADDEGKAAMYDPLPEGSKVHLLSHGNVLGWVEARRAKWLVESDGDLAYLAYYENPAQDHYREVFDLEPVLTDALARARAQVSTFKTAGDGLKLHLWAGLSAADRNYLATRDPAIQSWADQYGSGAEPLPESADPWATAAAAVQQQCHAIATAVAQLTGADGDAEQVAGLGNSHAALMGGVAELSANTDAGRAQAAAGLETAGAAFGVALAGYGEQPDAATLAELHSTSDTLQHWAVALA